MGAVDDFDFVVRDILMRGESARTVADKLGVAYSTMMREINPFDKGAKVGAKEIFRYMALTGDVSFLRWVANRLGYELRKIEG